ncbi:MAG TPA: MOSC N-terminal beta barrel domain-containing protein, partial [Polyangiaceae bacterium LLY-WYZ-15_(1-7)]|nr:MOSC N-terminal beta barrel domain-containing protein [Polyangiaceae bacterium LLY-WYZ-15_(1-7)]
MPLRLAELWVYPVKSCRGVRLPAAMATARGLEGDRRWMLVDPAGRFVSQRTEPALALVGVALEGKGEGEG